MLIYVIVLGLLAWLVFYILDTLPLPEPFGRIAKIIVVVIFVLILVLLLLQLVGGARPQPAETNHMITYADVKRSPTTEEDSPMAHTKDFELAVSELIDSYRKNTPRDLVTSALQDPGRTGRPRRRVGRHRPAPT